MTGVDFLLNFFPKCPSKKAIWSSNCETRLLASTTNCSWRLHSASVLANSIACFSTTWSILQFFSSTTWISWTCLRIAVSCSRLDFSSARVTRATISSVAWKERQKLKYYGAVFKGSLKKSQTSRFSLVVVKSSSSFLRASLCSSLIKRIPFFKLSES